jgi:hypothetical protein
MREQQLLNSGEWLCGCLRIGTCLLSDADAAPRFVHHTRFSQFGSFFLFGNAHIFFRLSSRINLQVVF